MQSEAKELSPLANLIVDRAIDNTNRKLVAGFRNKNNSRPGARSPDVGVIVEDSLAAASAKSAIEVANRGVAWREMIQKALSHGTSSLATMRFDGEFTVDKGYASGLDAVPNKPGVYVIYNKDNQPVYIGDSTRLKSRWHAGHLNEFRQGERSEEPYKLADEFKEGCTVRFVTMDSEETAAALEAHLIATEKPKGNSREELLNEQGKRSNIEAKKMKDASGSMATLATGAAKEAAKNSGWVVMEQLTASVMKALKDELVDIFLGGQSKILARIERFFRKVWMVIQRIIDAPLQLLKGVFEFIVNALSKTVRQIYQLARNLFDLGRAAWDLFHAARSMKKDELIRKISETIIASGTLVIWDALDPIIESQLLPLIGPFAPYAAAAISAIGFGISSYYLQQFVPDIVDFLLNTRTGYHDALDAQREACLKIIEVKEQEFKTIHVLGELVRSSAQLEKETRSHIQKLNQHTPIMRLDARALLEKK